MHVKRERAGHLAVPGSPPVRRYGPPQPPLQPFPLCQTLLDRGSRVHTLLQKLTVHPKTRRKFTALENAGCSRSGGTAMAENGSRGSPGRRGLKDMKPLPRLQFGEGVGTGGIRQSMDSVRSVHESLPGSPSMLSMRGCMAVSVSGIAPACRRVYRSAYLQQYGAR